MSFFINSATHVDVYTGIHTDAGDPFPHLPVEVLLLRPQEQEYSLFIKTVTEIMQWGMHSFPENEFGHSETRRSDIRCFFLKDDAAIIRFKLRWANG